MSRRAGILAGLSVALALAGCGESEKFSDKKISDAAKIQDGAVGGDPFCVVDDLLNDADEISEADAKKDLVILTSTQGNIGIVVVPPFPGDCEETVRQGLNKLDPKKQE